MNPETDSPTRKPRHRREATGKRRPAAALSPREEAVLTHLTAHEFLTAEHLAALDGGSSQRVSRLLQRLFHEGYIERVHPKELRLMKQYAYVYALTGQGRSAVQARQLALPLPTQRLNERNQRVTLTHVGERLLLSHFWVGLARALADGLDGRIAHWEERRSQLGIRFAYWGDGSGKLLPPADRLPAGAEDVRMVPDAWVVIETKPGVYLSYFLEAHSGEQTQGRFLEHCVRYWKLWRTGQGEPERGVGFQWRKIADWRMLTVCESALTAENLRQRSREADERKRGSDLFLFTSVEEADWRRPETFLGPVLHGGRGGRFNVLGTPERPAQSR